MNDFTPAWWLKGPHAQTVWGRLSRPRRLVRFEREVLTTPDDDDLVLDSVITPQSPVHFLLLHGLEGSSNSVYMQGLAATIARHGGSATALNFRSCARDPRSFFRTLPNRKPRFYHSGETTDFDFVVETLTKRHPETTFVAACASLGGNVLLKWLGEHPDQTSIAAAATISVPYDLGAGARYLERPGGRFYVGRFLASLKKKVAEVAKRFPETRTYVDIDAALRAKTFYDFDEAATGPLHGFTGAEDYYARSSSIHFVERITTPALCLSAADDPFLPPATLAIVRERASLAVELRVTAHGGHTGFVAGRAPWSCTYWAEELIVRWLLDKGTAVQ